jgi:TonB family protein
MSRHSDVNMLRIRPFALGLLAVCSLAGAAQAAPPSPEPPITAPGPVGDYLRSMHTAIHFRWANLFIEDVAAKRPPTDPLNKMSLEAEVLFTVRWDGSPAEVTVSNGSGIAAFDQAAIVAVKGDRPLPVPPIDVYGDDGVAHFRWLFARDARLCSGGEVRRVEAPLAEALPRLFYQGRIKEALLRVARYTQGGDAAAMSTFARAWLVRRQPDLALDARAAAALAHAGDARQADRLRPALNRPDTLPIAAPALAALKVDLCAQVRPRLKPTDAEGIMFATRVLQLAGAELPAGSPCIATLDDLLKMDALPVPLRAEALKTLAVVSPASARRPALNALGDSNAEMRATAATVFARPGGGRPTLYRLMPLVKDPALEVRTTVAAGLIRACGDLAIDYVKPLVKARDPEPLAAMAPELGKQTSAGTLDLLLKIQKRNDPTVRVPVLAALSERTDAPARAIYQPLAAAVKKDPWASPESRRIVYAGADVKELLPLMKDPALGLQGFKALLRAQRHAEAMDWLVGSFDRLPPEVLIDALGAWLANPPAHAASK